jgi:hypothetical protein
VEVSGSNNNQIKQIQKGTPEEQKKLKLIILYELQRN